MISKQKLIDTVKNYHNDQEDFEIIGRAYDFAEKAHIDQKRASGESYFSHPLEVAVILSEMQMDKYTISAALLHDTVEDCPTITHELIEQMFGSVVSVLVAGMTKVNAVENKSMISKQASNFSKLLLAISKDVRVLMIKLADRLHNMRTIKHIPNFHKRKNKAQETLDIYTPLAASLGISKIKDELEDLAFITINPEIHAKITKKLAAVKEHQDIIKDIIKAVDDLLVQGNIFYKIFGRIKRPYSIWNTMYIKNIDIEQLLDIVAFRIIVKNIEDCYKILGILHTNYRAIPLSMKDYISTPKANGYESIHTVLIGPHGQKIEIQIRTEQMHKVAEFGVAAHWPHYKLEQCKVQKNLFEKLLEIHSKSYTQEEFLADTKLEMFENKVFCFAPNGEIKELPIGATPVDFAYAIHSEIGNKCEAAKINGKVVPLMTRLNNGDQVEIITSDEEQPSHTWEHFVVTGKARVNIRKLIRNRKPEESIRVGKLILQQVIDKYGIKHTYDTVIKKLMTYSQPKSTVLTNIANGTLKIHDIVNLFITNSYPKIVDKTRLDSNSTIMLSHLTPGLVIHYGECCHPLPGDHVVGLVVSGHGIIVHTNNCRIAGNFADQKDKIVNVTFANNEKQHFYLTRLNIIADNSATVLASITNNVIKNNGNIVNVKIKSRSAKVVESIIDIEVYNTKHLSEIIAHLRSVDLINKVKRI